MVALSRPWMMLAAAAACSATDDRPDDAVVSSGAGETRPAPSARGAEARSPDAGCAAQSGCRTAVGFLRTRGAKIVDAENRTVRLTGINWFGFETANHAPHGLWARSLDALLDQVVALGYNMLRLPVSSQMLEPGAATSGIDLGKNPSLSGLSPLELLDVVVTKAGARGLRLVLDRHRPGSDAQSALWYTDRYPEARWLADLTALGRRYAGNRTVIGIDLHNEPHGAASWGDGNAATDWRLAAERAGAAIQAVNPELLVIVEGVENAGGKGGWWGGNLRGVRASPVRLPVPDHVVYSPHEYPASVAAQPWFGVPSFPANMDGLWDESWGYLVKEDIAPVWIGEFGTKLESASDRAWLQALLAYLGRASIGFAYWSLNPNSGDTGGILMDDWQTVHTGKQSLLSPLLAPPL